MNEKRKQDKRRTEAVKPAPAPDQFQPNKKDDELDERALDEVLRDCPL